ncbi:MAG: hypothetical protein RIQ47_217, partial [Bacteroidota bacterium]
EESPSEPEEEMVLLDNKEVFELLSKDFH